MIDSKSTLSVVLSVRLTVTVAVGVSWNVRLAGPLWVMRTTFDSYPERLAVTTMSPRLDRRLVEIGDLAFGVGGVVMAGSVDANRRDRLAGNGVENDAADDGGHFRAGKRLPYGTALGAIRRHHENESRNERGREQTTGQI